MLPSYRAAFFICLSAHGRTRATPELLQKRHHRAPVRERGLEEVQSDKRGEQKPTRIDEIAEREAQKDESARDKSQIPDE